MSVFLMIGSGLLQRYFLFFFGVYGNGCLLCACIIFLLFLMLLRVVLFEPIVFFLCIPCVRSFYINKFSILKKRCTLIILKFTFC